jgi:hypothetical protein
MECPGTYFRPPASLPVVSFCLAAETRCRESQTKVKFSFSIRSSGLADNKGREISCELCWLVFSVPNSAISVLTWPLESVSVIQILIARPCSRSESLQFTGNQRFKIQRKFIERVKRFGHRNVMLGSGSDRIRN